MATPFGGWGTIRQWDQALNKTASTVGKAIQQAPADIAQGTKQLANMGKAAAQTVQSGIEKIKAAVR